MNVKNFRVENICDTYAYSSYNLIEWHERMDGFVCYVCSPFEMLIKFWSDAFQRLVGVRASVCSSLSLIKTHPMKHVSYSRNCIIWTHEHGSRFQCNNSSLNWAEESEKVDKSHNSFRFRKFQNFQWNQCHYIRSFHTCSKCWASAAIAHLFGIFIISIFMADYTALRIMTRQSQTSRSPNYTYIEMNYALRESENRIWS